MIKQIVSGLSILTLAASANASLITNGDFEANGGSLDGWGDTNTIWGAGVSVVDDGTGNHYAHLSDPSSAGYEGLFQAFEVADGVDSITIDFSFNFEETGAVKEGWDIAWASLIKTDTSFPFIELEVLGSVVTDTNGWSDVSFVIDTSSLWETNPNIALAFNLTEFWDLRCSWTAGCGDKSNSSLSIDDVSITETYASVPEPSSLMLLGLGLVGFGLSRKRKS